MATYKRLKRTGGKGITPMLGIKDVKAPNNTAMSSISPTPIKPNMAKNLAHHRAVNKNSQHLFDRLKMYFKRPLTFGDI